MGWYLLALVVRKEHLIVGRHEKTNAENVVRFRIWIHGGLASKNRVKIWEMLDDRQSSACSPAVCGGVW